MLDDFSFRRNLARLQLDISHRHFTPFVVSTSDHTTGRHGRVLVERILHFDRRDVLAAGDDDVLGAILELDVAVGVHDTEIAGMKPAAGERLIRRFAVLQVALHDDVATEHHFADGLTVGRRLCHRRGSITVRSSSAA